DCYKENKRERLFTFSLLFSCKSGKIVMRKRKLIEPLWRLKIMANTNDNRQKALDEALKKIERAYGKGSVMKMGEKVETEISTVPSGSLAIDIALGVGGYPRGRIIEVYG